FIEAFTSGQSGLTQLRGKSWPIVIDRHAKETALREVAPGLRFYGDRNRVAGPFTSVIDEIADHLLEILAFSRKANGPVLRENKADCPLRIDFFEGTDQSLSGQGNLGDAPQRSRPDRDTGA